MRTSLKLTHNDSGDTQLTAVLKRGDAIIATRKLNSGEAREITLEDDQTLVVTTGAYPKPPGH